jgi:hypothetical protein
LFRRIELELQRVKLKNVNGSVAWKKKVWGSTGDGVATLQRDSVTTCGARSYIQRCCQMNQSQKDSSKKLGQHSVHWDSCLRRRRGKHFENAIYSYMFWKL